MATRRNTLIGLGILTAGGTGAVATGAFSAATAERDVTVEFADDDAGAIIGFESASDYADVGDDGMLSLTFDNLNKNADFTFQDTFRIVNNGSETVHFDRVQSAEPGVEGTANWNYNDVLSPAHVLVADEINGWQGSESSIEDEDAFEEGDTTNVGRTPARTALDGSTGPELGPGDWISIGFGFWGVEEKDNGSPIGNWIADDIPTVLQINFGG